MNYYTVPMIGAGTDEDPFRPDIPNGTTFSGNCSDGVYLLATNAELPVKTGRVKQLPRQALEAAANARGFKYDDVMTWFVG